MKKISVVLFTCLLCGCALGINQNVTEIDGKKYLLSTPTYMGPFGIGEWKGETEYKELDANIVQDGAFEEKFKDFIAHCRLQAGRGNQFNYQKFFECVNEKIK